MIDINILKNPEFYVDYQKGLDYLKTINDSEFEYPEEITNFHIYSEIKNDKELECIKSFLATQNLEKTNLIVWSDYDISNNPLIQPYKKFLDLRIWDPIKESVGTVLENSEHVTAKDFLYYLQSDLLRILVIYKYGGIWVDTDIIFLRDFKPIMDQEFMYQWGGDIDFKNEGACATVLSGKKNSTFTSKLMEELKSSEIHPNSTNWGKNLFARLWSKWPEFTIFPSSFFNTEWLISKTRLDFRKSLKNGFEYVDIDEDILFLSAFTWHWHNSSNKNNPIQPDSKFDRLQKITDSKLKNKNIV